MQVNKLKAFIDLNSKNYRILNYVAMICYLIIYIVALYIYRKYDIIYVFFFNLILLLILLFMKKQKISKFSYNQIVDFVSNLSKEEMRDYLNYLNSIISKQPTVLSDLICFSLTPLITYFIHFIDQTLTYSIILEIKLLFTFFSTFYLIKFVIYFVKNQARQDYICLLQEELYNRLLS